MQDSIQVPDWVSKWAVYSPKKIAVREVATDRALSYETLHHLGTQVAVHLTQDLGLKKGDRVAVLAENCLEYIVLFVVAQKTGLILIPLNYRLASAELDYMLQDTTPSLVLWEAKFEKKITATSAFNDISNHWTIEALADFCTQKNNQTAPAFQRATISPNDPVFILYTSGTTGFPKGALYTHQMLFWNSINTAMSLIVNTESRTINCMPPFHTGGWNVLTTPFLHHGGYTCLLKKFDAEVVLDLLVSEKPTVFMAVPTMLKMIADLPAFALADLTSVQYIICGGEPMPIPLIERWHQKGVPIRQGYGMTEVGPNLTSLHQDDAIRKKGSIGRPNFYVQTKIVNAQGEQVAACEGGELLLRGPMVTPGYWKNETATQKAIRNGWFHTGDRVLQDEEGYLFVVDRIKNMFISGGENVYPAEVERVLLEHPTVSAAAVIGVSDAKWGESGKAFVVVHQNEVTTAAELTQHCQAKLARFKVPKHFVFVKRLPMTDSGKIDRKALREG